METVEVKPQQLAILQHSLGLDQYGRGRQFRNHFVTEEGCSDHAHCVANVHAGLMTRRPGTVISGGGDIFQVTQAGVDHVALNSPKPPIQPASSRSQMRYQRFREYGESFDSFIDYCRWDADPARSWNGGVNSGGVIEGAQEPARIRERGC